MCAGSMRAARCRFDPGRPGAFGLAAVAVPRAVAPGLLAALRRWMRRMRCRLQLLGALAVVEVAEHDARQRLAERALDRPQRGLVLRSDEGVRLARRFRAPGPAH